MKIKQLLIATAFLAVFALTDCEAEAVAEPVVATEATPVVAEPAVVAPAPSEKEHYKKDKKDKKDKKHKKDKEAQ